MNHCSKLDDYLDGRMGEEDRASFEVHRKTCPSCDAGVASWQDVYKGADSLREYIDRTGPTDEKALRIVASAKAQKRVYPATRRIAWGAAAAVACAAILALVIWSDRRDPDPGLNPPIARPEPLPMRIVSVDAESGAASNQLKKRSVAVPKDERLVLEIGNDLFGLSGGTHIEIVRADALETRIKLNAGDIAVNADPAKNRRTLVVEAGSYLVRVVGTRFLVSLAPTSKLRVSVSAGTVKVLGPEDFGETIHKGVTASISSANQIESRPINDDEAHHIDGLLEIRSVSEAPAESTDETDIREIETASDKSGGVQSTTSKSRRHGKRTKRDLALWSDWILWGEYDRAGVALEEYLKNSRGDAETWTLLADCRRKQGKWRESVSAYRQVIQTGGSRAANRARFNAAILLQDKLGNHGAAARQLKTFLSEKDRPRTLEAEAMVRLARCHLRMGENAQARKLLGQVQSQYRGTSAAIEAGRLSRELDRD